MRTWPHTFVPIAAEVAAEQMFPFTFCGKQSSPVKHAGCFFRCLDLVSVLLIICTDCALPSAWKESQRGIFDQAWLQMPRALVNFSRRSPLIDTKNACRRRGHCFVRLASTDKSYFWARTGAYAAELITEAERFDVVRNACPGAGACGGMYTANTMASAIEALGMSLPYSSSTPAVDPLKRLECRKAGL